MPDAERRRPLKTRKSRLAHAAACWLSRMTITPNQISLASVGFAALAAGALAALPFCGEAGRWLLPIAAALFIQCRLLCNLLDGMVAIEGGKGTPSGELFNDIPDRFADLFILVAAGYATGLGWGAVLGWLAGVVALLTSYVRQLAAACGAPMNFRGPMAKQHRMALMTGACLLTAIEPLAWAQRRVLLAALVVVVAGGLLTVWHRARAAYLCLEGKADV